MNDFHEQIHVPRRQAVLEKISGLQPKSLRGHLANRVPFSHRVLNLYASLCFGVPCDMYGRAHNVAHFYPGSLSLSRIPDPAGKDTASLYAGQAGASAADGDYSAYPINLWARGSYLRPLRVCPCQSYVRPATRAQTVSSGWTHY